MTQDEQLRKDAIEMAGHCLQSLVGWHKLYPEEWDILDKIAMEEINDFLVKYENLDKGKE